MSDHRFLDLADLLRPDDLLVVNETRVRAARLLGRRVDTAGNVELFVLSRLPNGDWETLARPARRLRPGVEVSIGDLVATVISKSGGAVVVRFGTDDDEAAIEKAGVVPLPPYFHGDLPNGERYQTVYAGNLGSAAAPTAGLHFTEEVFRRLRSKGIRMATVDLHVSVDTFRPIASDDVDDHIMHSEWCSVPEKTAKAIAVAQRIVAVGTTVVRTLESRADGAGGVVPGEGTTDLFLKPGSRFQVVDALITNFHMPGSSLLVMLAAFMGSRWRMAYETALNRGYRFLSFGDAMYAEREEGPQRSL